MSGTSFLYRVVDETPRHVTVNVYAGPDEQHRAHLGKLIFRTDEWADFKDRVAGPGHAIERRVGEL